MNLISIRKNPEYKNRAIQYFQNKWGNESKNLVYEDCITHSIDAQAPLPQWYLLLNGNKIIRCSGLITNDFISRMDLYPWACALYIEEDYRGHSYGSLLLDQAKKDSKEAGFNNLYLCSDHEGFYEKYGFTKIGTGYHPWGESSGIFRLVL